MRFPSPEEWLQFPDEWLEALCGEEFSRAQPASVDLPQLEAPSWPRRHSLSDLPRGERRRRAEVNAALSNASPNAHAMTVPLVTQGGQGTSGLHGWHLTAISPNTPNPKWTIAPETRPMGIDRPGVIKEPTTIPAATPANNALLRAHSPGISERSA